MECPVVTYYFTEINPSSLELVVPGGGAVVALLVHDLGVVLHEPAHYAPAAPAPAPPRTVLRGLTV